VETLAASFLSAHLAWLLRYSGGMPVGFLAAIAAFESGGQMIAGDADLGEYGYFQIEESLPGKFGYPSQARKNREWNIFLAGLEYQTKAQQLKNDGYRGASWADQWKLARLAFAVGNSGARYLWATSGASTYDGLIHHVQSHGAPALGRQSSDKVQKRVLAVQELWHVGQRVFPQPPGPPERIPSPDGSQYQMPTLLRPWYWYAGIQAGIVAGLLIASERLH